MKRSDEKRLIARHNFRVNIWNLYCPKEYPRGLPTRDFLQIILNKAEKTYLGYENCFNKIHESDLWILEEKLFKSRKSLLNFFESISTVRNSLLPEIQKNGLQKDYDDLLSEIESLIKVVFQKWCSVSQIVIEQTVQKLLVA